MPANVTPKSWKVTFKEPTSGEEDTVYSTAITRIDAIQLASERTKLDPTKCVVSATTRFDHFTTPTTEKPVETKGESNMDLRYEEFLEDNDKSCISPEEMVEDTSIAVPAKMKLDLEALVTGAMKLDIIKTALCVYFANEILPSLTMPMLLHIFQDTSITLTDLRSFLELYNKR